MYVTLPDELVELAAPIESYYRGRGYKVVREPDDLPYPYTPALKASRGPLTILVEVDDEIDGERMEEWANFCRSTSRDTRVVLALPVDVARTGGEDLRLKGLGVGVLLCSVRSGATEAFAPRDVSLNLQLPSLNSWPVQAHAVAGAAYEQFERSQWREGFEEICQGLEVAVRRHLMSGMRAGRLRFLRSNGTVRPVTEEFIDRQPIGRLIELLDAVQTPSRVDSQLSQILARINKDRIGVVHKKHLAVTEKRLRKNVGMHVWSALSAFKLLFPVPPRRSR